METMQNNSIVEKLAEATLDNLLNDGTIETSCSEYGEQGYELDDSKRGILLSNWNEFDKYPNFMEWLEKHYELEWSDEWVVDYNESKCYRCQPDSYGWQQQFRFDDYGELITPDSDIEEWVDYAVARADEYNSENRVLPSFIDDDELVNLGFTLIDDDFENGWYDRHDDPKKIAQELFDKGHGEVLFKLSGVGQFAVNFQVFFK